MASIELLEYATGSLCDLASYVDADKVDPKILSGLNLDGEQLVGVYFCSQIHYIVITTEHLRLCGARTELIIPYSQLAAVEIPDKDAAEIKLTLESGEVAWIDVENETDNTADLPEVFMFLRRLRQVFQLRTQRIKSVTSKEELVAFLREPDFWNNRKSHVADWVEKHWPPPDRLEGLDIAPSFLERPEVWRLLALFISMPIERLSAEELDDECGDGDAFDEYEDTM